MVAGGLRGPHSPGIYVHLFIASTASNLVMNFICSNLNMNFIFQLSYELHLFLSEAEVTPFYQLIERFPANEIMEVHFEMMVKLLYFVHIDFKL